MVTSRMHQAVGPDGLIITLASLPPPNGRWVAHRKAEVVAAVQQGLLTISDACQRYALSMDEFQEWERAYVKHGVPGLRSGYRH